MIGRSLAIRPARAQGWTADPDVQANDRPPGRMYVFAVDEVSPDHALRTRVFLRQFLEEQFGPDDLGAIVLVGRGLVTSGQAFTRSPRRLLDALDSISGGFQQEQPCGSGQTQVPTAPGTVGIPMPRTNTVDYYVRNRLAALRQLTESLAVVPGGRKTVLYFTQCIGFDMFDVLDYRGGVMSLAAEDAHAAIAAATRGSVVIYPINPAGLQVDDLGSNRAQEDRLDLTALGTATGGFALSNSNNFSGVYARIVAENSAYYTLGFVSGYERRDGRFVPVEVRVRRPGLTVRTREGYVAPLGTPRGDRPPAASAMSAALANPLATRGLPIRAFAAPYASSSGEAAVTLTAEIDISGLALVDRDGQLEGTLEISYAATDDRNRAWPGAVHAVTYARPRDAGPPPPGSCRSSRCRLVRTSCGWRPDRRRGRAAWSTTSTSPTSGANGWR